MEYSSKVWVNPVGRKAAGDLDRIDLQILARLQADGRLTIGELAELVALSQSPCWRRVQQLEQAGFIEGLNYASSPSTLVTVLWHPVAMPTVNVDSSLV